MKKFYSLSRSWFIPVLLLLYGLNCEAQQKASPDMYNRVASQVTFVVHAPVVLPALLERKQYDTMGYYLQNWKNSYAPNLEFNFAIQVLLAIQSEKYNSYQLPFDCLNYLSAYAKLQNAMETKGAAFRYYVELDNRYSYDATEAARNIILFIQSWSKELIKTRKLTTSQLFICRSLSGNIAAPVEEFRSYPEICPDIERVQEQLRACKDRYFADQRRDPHAMTMAITVGGWFPTHNLRALGAHPSLGFLVGWRNRLNEYDLVGDYRFIGTTPQYYDYLRQGTLYTDNYYEGAYVGVEYTRYLVHTTRTDMGLTTGVGYDHFNLPGNAADSSNNSHPDPAVIGSFNWNAGVRYKYFVRRKLNLGFVAKYNMIHYVNTGGTNLDGNAFTLEFTIGVN